MGEKDNLGKAIGNAVDTSMWNLGASDNLQETISIPIALFSNRQLSLLENIIFYLKNNSMTNSQIARIINRDERTVSSVLCRIKKKLQNYTFPDGRKTSNSSIKTSPKLKGKLDKK